jgi:hypothetical protein
MLDRHDDCALENDGALDDEIETETETDRGEVEAEEVISIREYQAGFWS